MRFGIIGSGSWATALAKILTDKKHAIHWWIRNTDSIEHLQKRRHNPHYLSSAYFDVSLLTISPDIKEVVRNSDVLVIAVPSAYAEESLASLRPVDWNGKKVISAIKGLLPGKDILLNYYLQQQFNIPLEDYFAVLGPVMLKKWRQRNCPISLSQGLILRRLQKWLLILPPIISVRW